MLHIRYVESFECDLFRIYEVPVLHRTDCSYFVFCVYMYIVQVNAAITKLLNLLFIKFHDNILPFIIIINTVAVLLDICDWRMMLMLLVT